MFLSSAYWPISLLFALVAGLFTFAVAYFPGTSVKAKSLRSNKSEGESNLLVGTIGIAAIGFGIGLLLQRLLFYYFQPTLIGSWFGYFWPLFVALISATVLGTLSTQGRGLSRSILAWVVLLGVPTVQWLYVSYAPWNTQRFADLANVTRMTDDDIMPPTDEMHLVQVTESMANQKAQAVLSSKSGYSTKYKVGKMVLQAIKKHRYWAAPLVPTNTGDTFVTPLLWGRSESPGYVLVDAEDHEADAQLKDGFRINLFTDMPFNMNLERFIYMSGYTHGTLDDPTFEVDDEGQPHYTVTYLTPAFGDIAGSLVKKVLVVDFGSEEPVLHEYVAGDARIKWVDRVLSDDVAIEYATSWGTWGQAYAQGGLGNWFQLMTGLSKSDVIVPADAKDGLMHSYDKDDHNVLVVPMTSKGNTDKGVVGVLVFESNEVKARYYPGIKGFNHASSATATMFGVSGNAASKYTVENVELYNIYGRVTWVAIYAREQELGSTYGGIGFMDAKKQSVSDVAYSQDLQTALTAYTEKMSPTTGRALNGVDQDAVLNGTIWRIAPNKDSYRFRLNGDPTHYFDVTTSTYQGAPLLRDGDKVSGSFMDTHQALATVRSLQLVGEGPAAAAKSDAK